MPVSVGDRLRAATGPAACYLSPRIGGRSPRLDHSPSPSLSQGASSSSSPLPEAFLPSLSASGQQRSRKKGQGATSQAPGGSGESPRLPKLLARPSPRTEATKLTVDTTSEEARGWDAFFRRMSVASIQEEDVQEMVSTLDREDGEGTEAALSDASIAALEEELDFFEQTAPATKLRGVNLAGWSNQKTLGAMMKPFVPPPEPNIAAICRDTFQVMCTQREQLGTEIAFRRRQRDVATRRKGRQKAAAWRKASEERDKVEHEQLLAEKEALALAKLKAEELVIFRTKLRKNRWVVVKQRLSDLEEPKASKSVANEKVGLKRKALLQSKRVEKQAQRQEVRRLYFEELNVYKRRSFEEVFSLYDSDGSGSLQAPELCECLLEMGFRGHDAEERAAVVGICESTVAHNLQAGWGDGGAVGLHELAADVVPAVSRALNKIRKASFLESLSSVEWTDEGFMDFEQVLDNVKELWPFEGSNDSDDTNAVQANLIEDLNTATKQFTEEKINLTDYIREVTRIVEDVNWNLFKLQQAVKRQHQITPALFRQFRTEITQLDRIFKSVDIDQSGKLDKEECTRLFKEIGLVPRSLREKEEMMQLLNDSMRGLQGIKFQAFLNLITKSRHMLENRLVNKLKHVYPPWSKDQDATITCSFLNNNLFKEVNIMPRSRNELRAVGRVIRDANMDGDDMYSLKEVVQICRKSQEYMRQMRLQEEMVAARGLGFSEAELNQARWAFEQLDDDGSGSLDKTETRKAMGLLGGNREQISNKRFAIAFEKLDGDRSGSLELPEFLRMIHFMKDPTSLDNDDEADNDDYRSVGVARKSQRFSLGMRAALALGLGPDQKDTG